MGTTSSSTTSGSDGNENQSSTTSGSDGNENQSPGVLMKSVIKTLNMKFPSVKNISTQRLASWLAVPEERAVAVVDCRADEEYNVSHIDGAINAAHQKCSIEEVVEKCDEKLNDKSNPTIVCYCSVGYRSSDLAQDLSKFYQDPEKQPSPEIYNLEGSLFQWAQERRPMIDQNGQATKFVHPFSGFFGKLVDKELRKKSI